MTDLKKVKEALLEAATLDEWWEILRPLRSLKKSAKEELTKTISEENLGLAVLLARDIGASSVGSYLLEMVVPVMDASEIGKPIHQLIDLMGQKRFTKALASMAERYPLGVHKASYWAFMKLEGEALIVLQNCYRSLPEKSQMRPVTVRATPQEVAILEKSTDFSNKQSETK